MSYVSKERALEAKWSSLLSRDNVSDAMDNPDSVHRLAASWKQIFVNFSGEDIDFHSLESLSKQLLELCQSRKWYKSLSPEDAISLERDVKVYVAYLIWDIKRVNNNICSEKYWRLASERHFAKRSRIFSCEGANHALNTQIDKQLEKLKTSIDKAEAGTLTANDLKNLNAELELLKGNMSEIKKQLQASYMEKIDSLWKGENKLISLPIEQGDYIQLPSAETINENMEGAA